MDSIEKGATIRIGFKDHYNRQDPSKVDFQVPTYSLKINKKSIVISDSAGISSDYLNIYEGVAKELAEIMKEKNVSNYVIHNGEMVDMWTKKWASCNYVPKDGEEIFKKTLEKALE